LESVNIVGAFKSRVRRPAVLPPGMVTSQLFFNWLQKGSSLSIRLRQISWECLALLVLVLDFGASHLAHGGGESYIIGDGTVIADFEELFRGSLDFCHPPASKNAKILYLHEGIFCV